MKLLEEVAPVGGESIWKTFVLLGWEAVLYYVKCVPCPNCVVPCYDSTNEKIRSVS